MLKLLVQSARGTRRPFREGRFRCGDAPSESALGGDFRRNVTGEVRDIAFAGVYSQSADLNARDG